jgi:hypothetical protein
MRDWLQLVGLVLLEVVLFAMLWVAGRYVGSVSLSHLGTWVRDTKPGDAIAPLMRLGGLVASGWLLVTTVLYSLVTLARPERALETESGVGQRRLFGWAPPRLVRRVVDGVATASMLLSAVGTSAAMAAPPPAATAAPQTVPPPTAGIVAIGRNGVRSNSAAVIASPAAPRLARATAAGDSAATPARAVGRHLPHPPGVVHRLPAVELAAFEPSAPSASNGFRGLPLGTKVVVVKPGDCL